MFVNFSIAGKVDIGKCCSNVGVAYPGSYFVLEHGSVRCPGSKRPGKVMPDSTAKHYQGAAAKCGLQSVGFLIR